MRTDMKRRFPVAILLVVGTLIFAGCGSDESDGTDENYSDAMAREHEGDTPTGNDVAWLEPAVPVNGSDVEYASVDGAAISGYFATPEHRNGTEMPGLIVIHEWWGLNENIEAMARRLAGEGYMALAVDMYGNNVAETPDSAKALMQKVMDNPKSGVDNLGQAIDFLKKQGATRIGVIGWCFGGGWSLQTALNFPDQIEATVIYYGHLENDPEQLAKLDMPVLGIFGEEDTGIPVEGVRAFESTLDSLGVEKSIHIYPNASHAFANPSGERYNAEAATDAWSKTEAFLAEHLKGAE